MGIINIPKGTKDVLPKDIYKWNYVEDRFRDMCKKYGFTEIRTPVFEHTELFKRGVGETTDIVEKQMYSFTDYANRNITLKPEGTAPVVRSYIENKLYADSQITKVFYITPCFRYEKPQSGRLREFHQFGVETMGAENPVADAEVIAVGVDFFESFGIDNLEVRINSIGCPKCRGEYREKLRAFLAPKFDELCETCKVRYDKNPMRILDCKSEICQSLVTDAPRMLKYICGECKNDFEIVKNSLDAMGIGYIVDSGIVRGLDYYRKTAFEIVSNTIGAQGTVCGGGRYDGLIEEIGGPSSFGVGFGLGIERLLLVLESCGIEIPKPELPDVFLLLVGEEASQKGLKLLRALRLKGKTVEIDLVGRNFKNQMKYANKIGAKKVIIIGEDEIKEGVVSVKDMTTGEQKKINEEEIF